MKKLVARIYEIEQGQNQVVLSEKDAQELSLEVFDRVCLRTNGNSITAMVGHSESFVKPGEILLFYEAAKNLKAYPGQEVGIEPAQKPPSIDYIRNKLDGKTLSNSQIGEIVSDLMSEKLSTAELSAFVSAVHIRGLSPHEISSLANAIFKSGNHLSWKSRRIASMHSIGGVAGDRSTMLVVPIIASAGILIPKTVTRAISSASGTADAMEVLAPVSLTTPEIKKVVENTGGCIVWGGAVDLAVADDRLIKIRNPLRLDPEGLVLSSILAKKKAEGVRHVLIDVPLGRGAKVEDMDKARFLAQNFKNIGSHLGLNVKCIISDGATPLLRTVGPALEARAVLEILKGGGGAALAEKSCIIAGMLISMADGVSEEKGIELAKRQLGSGKALKKMREIISAQGGNPDVKPEEIEIGGVTKSFYAAEDCTVSHVDNRNLAMISRALGAPVNKKAGVILACERGDRLKRGRELFRLVTTDKAKLDFAECRLAQFPLIQMKQIILDKI
ncbi:MAG: thymidine phosphorylase [Candidatus Micrarchaeota archaeon]|nr:thymidine phosphorylase [Candidatus Micrarchaeota archaeon]